jgi:hypothetical protein
MILAATNRSKESRRACCSKANKHPVIYVTRSRCWVLEKAGSRSSAWWTSEMDERLFVTGLRNCERNEQHRAVGEQISKGVNVCWYYQ